MYIGLSTCPTHSSGNVGDKLITDSMIKLLKEEKNDIEIETYFRREDFSSRLDHINKAKCIFLFGFPLVNNIIPKIYRFAEDLDYIKPPIIPISAAYKFFPGDKKLLDYKSLNKSSKRFINRVIPNCPDQKIPVRTEWVGYFLELQGFKSKLVGDPAWYDLDYIDKSFHNPDHINQIVFTPPHKRFYLNQAKEILKRLSVNFEESKKIISFQSALKGIDREIRQFAKKYGWTVKYTSHDTENIEFYRQSDLHVGYRKHGHLAHLRWRRPSIVLAEDSRAMGLTDTFGTAGFPAFESRFSARTTHKIMNISQLGPISGCESLLNSCSFSEKLPIKERKVAKPNQNITSNLIKFLNIQLENNWNSYDKVQKKIDKTYHYGMKPFIENILSI